MKMNFLVLVMMSFLSIQTFASEINHIALIDSEFYPDCDGYCSGLIYEDNYIHRLELRGREISRVVDCYDQKDIVDTTIYSNVLSYKNLIELKEQGSTIINWLTKNEINGVCLQLLDYNDRVLEEVHF